MKKSWKLSGYQILIERAGLDQKKEGTKRSRKKIAKSVEEQEKIL